MDMVRVMIRKGMHIETIYDGPKEGLSEFMNEYNATHTDGRQMMITEYESLEDVDKIQEELEEGLGEGEE